MANSPLVPTSPKAKLASIPRRIYLLVILVGCIVTGLVGLGFYTGHRMNTIYAPLIDAAMEIKLEATAAHLWFEEALSGDSDTDFHTVWRHLEEVLWYLKAMLAGGENFEGTFVPLPDAEVRQEIKALQGELATLKSIVLQRLTRDDSTGPHSEMDQDFDDKFRSFIERTDRIETRLQQLMAQSLRRFKLLQAILISACVVLAVFIGISLQRFERRRVEDFLALQGANADLAAEVLERQLAEARVRAARDELEQKVQERTLALARANQELKHEIGVRRQTEQELLAFQAKLRSLSSGLSLSEERERRRIAVNLHDRIGQNLAAIALTKLGEVGGLKSPREINAALDEIRGLIRQMIEDTRLLMDELSPPILYELGLADAIRWLIDKLQGQHGLPITFDDDQQPKPLDEGMRVFIFQAVHELLDNIVQHAEADSAKVSLRRESNHLCIDIDDNGIGFDPAETNSDTVGSHGVGIFKIRERLRHFGGNLEIISQPGKGTHATLISPLQIEEADAPLPEASRNSNRPDSE